MRRHLFGIPVPWKTLKKRLDASVPWQTARSWELIQRIETGDGKIIVFDPWYHHPDYHDPDHAYDVTLEGPVGGAQVLLKRIEIDVNHWRNASVKILFSDLPATHHEKIGEVGVDSAMLAVASANLYRSHWRIGGEYSENSIWIGFMDKDARIAEGQRAASLISESGFELRHEHTWLYRFVKPLSDTDIQQVNSLLQEVGIHGKVNTVVDHSLGLIRSQLAQHHVAVLDANSEPYLVAFESGWGDGTYDWFALKSGSVTVGFISQLIELDAGM